MDYSPSVITVQVHSKAKTNHNNHFEPKHKKEIMYILHAMLNHTIQTQSQITNLFPLTIGRPHS